MGKALGRYDTQRGSDGNLALRGQASQEKSQWQDQWLRLMLVGDAKVYARQAGSGDLIAGFEVQDDVVLMAAGIVVTDSASVWAFLRSKGISLKLKPSYSPTGFTSAGLGGGG
jgi:hypothetical protein